jgi:hypothetical protein
VIAVQHHGRAELRLAYANQGAAAERRLVAILEVEMACSRDAPQLAPEQRPWTASAMRLRSRTSVPNSRGAPSAAGMKAAGWDPRSARRSAGPGSSAANACATWRMKRGSAADSLDARESYRPSGG